jgi:hypothetical protein
MSPKPKKYLDSSGASGQGQLARPFLTKNKKAVVFSTPLLVKTLRLGRALLGGNLLQSKCQIGMPTIGECIELTELHSFIATALEEKTPPDQLPKALDAVLIPHKMSSDAVQRHRKGFLLALAWLRLFVVKPDEVGDRGGEISNYLESTAEDASARDEYGSLGFIKRRPSETAAPAIDADDFWLNLDADMDVEKEQKEQKDDAMDLEIPMLATTKITDDVLFKTAFVPLEAAVFSTPPSLVQLIKSFRQKHGAVLFNMDSAAIDQAVALGVQLLFFDEFSAAVSKTKPAEKPTVYHFWSYLAEIVDAGNFLSIPSESAQLDHSLFGWTRADGAKPSKQ